MTIDIAGLIEILHDAAQSEIMPRFRNLSVGDVTEKTSSLDLVTQADIGAERLITAALRARYPGALYVGEESYEADRSVIPALREAELAFVIDPIDGTFNYAAGLNLFGTIVAVTMRGETVAGVIYDPILGDALTAIKGEGAYLRRGDGQASRLTVAAPAPLDEMIGMMSWSHMVEPRRSQVAGNMAKARLALNYGCSAYEYWMVATGRIHFIGHELLMPWDHLAGVLIHQEAGGHTARLDGSPYRPGDLSGGIISAPDRASWDVVRREIVGD